MKKLFALFLFLVVTNLTFITNSNAETHDNPSKTILVLGDSLSAGYNMDESEGWVNLLQQRLIADGYSYKVINGSVSGDTTNQGIQRLKPLLAEHTPDLVIIELGGNDGLRGFPPQVIKNNLGKLIDMSKSAQAEVLLLGMRILPNYGQRYADAFFNNYAKLAEEKDVELVPFFLDGVGGKPELMQDDGIHPNQKAQPILMENILPFIIN
ncbi:MAG: arylesterase [Kangiellaceae bacterium]|nr:arylesterase [Kangiellaceae bacterium]